jgi:hypothetical protein
MTRSRRRRPKIRVIALAAVCCVALFALTAPAFAMPIRGPVNAPTLDQGQGGIPLVKAGDNPATRVPVASAATTDTPSYRSGDIASVRVPVASAATTDAPSYRSGDIASLRVPDATKVASVTGPSYRSGDVASTRVPGTSPTFVSVPSAPRTIVQDNGGQTLAIVLAGSALGIALAGAGFALLRTRMPKTAGLH